MKKNTPGFTYLEIIIVVMILIILFSTLIINYNPIAQKASARDKKRISDLSLLDRAINEYVLDNQNFPDTNNTLRVSTLLPQGSMSLDSAQSGWIQANFLPYSSRMPLDPLNDEDYYYRYIHNDNSYELNARLEVSIDLAEEDGGNDDELYELGNNLNLISP